MKFGNPVPGRIGPIGKPDPDSGFVVTRGFADESMPQYGPHDGLDIDNGGPSGDPVLAMADGDVYQAFFDSASGGAGIIRIDHGDGWTTGYAHMDTIEVGVGDRVALGATIGRLDTTGWATGPHLHYDISEGSRRVDPWPYCNAAIGEGAFWMHTYGGADFAATNEHYVTLAGARFRADTATTATIHNEFAAGVAVQPHAWVKGASVNGDDQWALAWMYTGGKYRMGAFHRSTLKPA